MGKFIKQWLNAINQQLRAFSAWRNRASYVVSEITCFAFIMFVLISALYVYGPILRVLSPFITLLFVLSCTGFTLQREMTAFLSITGIALYIACWPITWYINEMLGQIVCYGGVMTWFISLGLTLLPENKKKRTA